jgi:hypothetical protein
MELAPVHARAEGEAAIEGKPRLYDERFGRGMFWRSLAMGFRASSVMGVTRQALIAATIGAD